MAFYKLQDENLLIAENFVHTPMLSMRKENSSDKAKGKKDGWEWFNTYEEALNDAFNFNIKNNVDFRTKFKNDRYDLDDLEDKYTDNKQYMYTIDPLSETLDKKTIKGIKEYFNISDKDFALILNK